MIKNLKTAEITPNPDQPRKHFDEEALKELAASIVSDGLQSPILVRPKGEGYEIVQGERRYRAHVLAGLETIRAEVRELSDEDTFHLSVIENIQREQLTPIEEAQAFLRYVEMGLTHDQIATKVSKSRTYVTTRLRLLKLIPRIQDWIAMGRLSEGHAKQILRMESIISRFWEGGMTYGKTHFEFFQEKFVNSFWSKLDDGEPVTVVDVKKWGDAWHYGMINATILHYKGKGDTVVSSNRGLTVTAEMECALWNLHISKITEDDISFANAYDLESLRDEFNDKFRPWMVDKFWDEVMQELFHSGKDVVDKWTAPRSVMSIRDSLEDHEREIRKQMDKIHASLFLFAKSFHEFADEKGLERLSDFEIAKRFCAGNDDVFTVEEVTEMIGKAMTMKFPQELLDELTKQSG